MTTQIELARKELLEVLENLHMPSGYINSCQWVINYGQLVADALAGEWRTIDSAPKQQKGILGYFPESKCSMDMFWCLTHEKWESFSALGHHAFTHEPTHWQPLPSPPREKEAE